MHTIKDLLKKTAGLAAEPRPDKVPTEGPPAEPSPTVPGVGRGVLDETRKPKPLPVTSWQKMGLSKR